MRTLPNKVEIYVPLQSMDERGGLVDIPEIEKHLFKIQDMIMDDNSVSGFTLKDEKGAYRTSSGKINKMDNAVFCFYTLSVNRKRIEDIALYILQTLNQESVLIVINDKAELYSDESEVNDSIPKSDLEKMIETFENDELAVEKTLDYVSSMPHNRESALEILSVMLRNTIAFSVLYSKMIHHFKDYLSLEEVNELRMIYAELIASNSYRVKDELWEKYGGLAEERMNQIASQLRKCQEQNKNTNYSSGSRRRLGSGLAKLQEG